MYVFQMRNSEQQQINVMSTKMSRSNLCIIVAFGRGHEGGFWGADNVLVLIWCVQFRKIHRAVHLRCVYFSIFMLYFN